MVSNRIIREACTGLYIPSPAKGPRETFSLAAPAVFLGAILSTCWGSGMEYGKEGKKEVDRPQMAWIQKMTGVCPTHGGSHSDWLRLIKGGGQASLAA